MALAAAHFETGADQAERDALLWLERLEAPQINAAGHSERAMVTQYVPVNDKPGDAGKPPTATIQSAPQLARDRQPRSFARAWLEDDTVYYSWPSAEPTVAVRRALEGLCAKVTRVGHSTSMVQMWVASDAPRTPDWVPDGRNGTLQMRVAGAGLLEELERRYARRTRPRIPTYAPYAGPTRGAATVSAQGSAFELYPLIVAFEREEGPYPFLDLCAVFSVAERMREAVISQTNGLPERIRSLLSGHRADGGSLPDPHLALLPLAFVGHPHADGRILGMALTLPSSVSLDERRVALQAIARVRQLLLGPLGVWSVVPPQTGSLAWNLRAEAWTAYPDGATHWATVTPVVFDRHPKSSDRARYQMEVADMIATACVRIGLPEPRNVAVTSVSRHAGAPPSFAFPRLRRKDGGERRHTHAMLEFGRPVCGPISIGAGRFCGYGFCRPLSRRQETRS